MSKKLQLSIPTPCHENWDAMTPVEKGRFCDSCQKQVVDFSNMSDRQVAEFFKKPTTGSVCGRFMTDQLDRDIEISKKRIPWLKYFFQFTIPAFLVSLKVSAEKTQGKVLLTTTSPVKPPKINISKVNGLKVSPIDTSIESTSPAFENGTSQVCTNPLTNANVLLRGAISVRLGGVSVRTYEEPLIILDGKPLANNKKLRDINNIESITVLKNPEATALYGIAAMNGVIVVQSKKAKQDSVLKKDSQTGKHLDKSLPFSAIPFKIFPNPISSGSNLNIEVKQAEEGYYSLQLLNQSGQSIYQQEIWIDAEAKLLSIDMPVLPGGNYFLVLVNKNSGKRFTEKLILQ